MPRNQATETLLQVIGGVFFVVCDADDRKAEKAIKSLRCFADINSDNPACYALCQSLADAQETAMRLRASA